MLYSSVPCGCIRGGLSHQVRLSMGSLPKKRVRVSLSLQDLRGRRVP